MVDCNLVDHDSGVTVAVCADSTICWRTIRGQVVAVAVGGLAARVLGRLGFCCAYSCRQQPPRATGPCHAIACIPKHLLKYTDVDAIIEGGEP